MIGVECPSPEFHGGGLAAFFLGLCALLWLCKELRRWQDDEPKPSARGPLGSALASLPVAVIVSEALQLWSAAGSLVLQDGGDVSEVTVALVDAPPFLFGCLRPADGNLPGTVASVLLPHTALAALLAIAVLQVLVSAAAAHCLPRGQRWGLRSAAGDGLSLERDFAKPSLRTLLRLAVIDALLAYLLLLQFLRVSLCRTALRALRCAMGGNGPRDPPCLEAAPLAVIICLGLLLNVLLPAAAALWASRTSLRSLSRALSSELHVEAQLLFSTAAVSCLEFGAWRGEAAAHRLAIQLVEALFLAEVLWLLGPRWKLRAAPLQAFVALRSGLLVNVLLLGNVPGGLGLQLSAGLVAAGFALAALAALLPLLRVRCPLPWPRKEKGASHEQPQMRRTATELPKMSLHVITADPREFKAFYSSLSKDELRCLDTAASILKRRLLTSPLAASATSISVQWALSIGESEKEGDDLLNTRVFGSQGGGQPQSLWAPCADHAQEDASTPCGKLDAVMSNSKSCGAIIGGQGLGQLAQARAMMSSQSAQDILSSGPFVLPSEPEPKDAGNAASSGEKPKSAGHDRQQKGTPAHQNKRPELVKRQISLGNESTLSMTVSEQGIANLARAAEFEKTVGAIAGQGGEASRKSWVDSEGAKSQMLFQRYTRNANPEELRLPKNSDVRARNSDQTQTTVPTTAYASNAAFDQRDDVSSLCSDASSANLSGLCETAQAVLDEADCPQPLSEGAPDDPATRRRLPDESSPRSTVQEPEEVAASAEAAASSPEAAAAGAAEASDRWAKWKQRRADKKERKAKKEETKATAGASKRSSCPGRVMHQRSKESSLWSDESGHEKYNSMCSESMSCCSSRQSQTSKTSGHTTLQSGIFQLSTNFSQRPDHSAWQYQNDDSESSYRAWR